MIFPLFCCFLLVTSECPNVHYVALRFIFQLKVHLKDMIAICDLISKSNLFVQHTRINNLDSCSRFWLLDNKIICRCPFELQTKIFVAQKETYYQTISFQTKPIFQSCIIYMN